MTETREQKIKNLEELLGQDPASPRFAELASYYLEVGRPEDALSLCDQGLAQYPFYATGHLIKGRTLLAMNMRAEARREFELVHGAVPNSDTVANYLKEIPPSSDESLTEPPAPPATLDIAAQGTVVEPSEETQAAIPEPSPSTEASPAEQPPEEPELAGFQPTTPEESPFPSTDATAPEEAGIASEPETFQPEQTVTPEEPVAEPGPEAQLPDEGEPFEQFAERKRSEMTGMENTMTLDEYLSPQAAATEEETMVDQEVATTETQDVPADQTVEPESGEMALEAPTQIEEQVFETEEPASEPQVEEAETIAPVEEPVPSGEQSTEDPSVFEQSAEAPVDTSTSMEEAPSIDPDVPTEDSTPFEQPAETPATDSTIEESPPGEMDETPVEDSSSLDQLTEPDQESSTPEQTIQPEEPAQEERSDAEAEDPFAQLSQLADQAAPAEQIQPSEAPPSEDDPFAGLRPEGSDATDEPHDEAPPEEKNQIEELAEKLQGAKKITPVINLSERTPPSEDSETPSGGGFVTPTLAEIYAKQGWYDDAIKAYKALAASKPAEKGKFESRIEELEELKRQQDQSGE